MCLEADPLDLVDAADGGDAVHRVVELVGGVDLEVDQAVDDLVLGDGADLVHREVP